ncbi:hypothetical protein K0P33_17260 [Pseudomonas sp. ArH3a]|uniref:hypothetical protein n=1 Tax=Pseudomonas sp. ArH3a TaxID=2862945 RepID=UPI001F59B33D|nr:hypothetical protein [Pseudomonas sp. ArH3a]UNM17332.1 hypothetical protein K0P33_17260 [Pseudomonas sp. ArH3a]
MSNQWKLVPVEPTESMVINGFESEPDECFSDEEVWEQYQEMSGCQQAAFRAKLCWAAMLAAAPVSPQAARPVAELKAYVSALETFEADDGTFVRLSDVVGAIDAYTHADAGEVVPECFCIEHGMHIEQLKQERNSLRALLVEVRAKPGFFSGEFILRLDAALSTTAKPEADHE